MQSQALRPMQGLMRRNYAAALIDEIQQAINALLDNDPYEANNWQYHPEKYARYPDYLQRTIELLGEKHYLYASLMCKKCYFEGYNIAKTLVGAEGDPTRRDVLRNAAKQKYLEAIGFDPDAAYLYYAIGDMYFANNPYQTDSLVLWCSRAAETSPGWVTPLLRISDELTNVQGAFAKSEVWVRCALQVLPDSYQAQEKLGFLHFSQGHREEAFAVAQQMIADKPDMFNAYTLMTFVHFFLDSDFPATEFYAQKSAERNPSPNNWALNFQAGSQIYLYSLPEAIERIKHLLEGSTGVERGYRSAFLIEALAMAKRYDEADTIARQILAENLPPYIQTDILQKYGKMRVSQNRLAEAADYFQKSLEADPTPDPMFILDYAWLGEIARLQHRTAEAEVFFQKALAYSSGFGEDLRCKDEARYLYGNFLLRQNRRTEAQEQFQKSLDIRKKGFWGEYGFALLAAAEGRRQEALDWLERSLDNYFPEAKPILEEPLFKKLRKTKRFRELMAKHFPETTKQ
ncbi:MAG: tetratricopeptide repeat protein [Lewinellaceae bacterium]|nr:tetratricopeptide repeat protein [Lewinellaceae bacterium]